MSIHRRSMGMNMDVHFEYHGNTFVWDKGKARSNLHKHGVAFEEAAAAFFDPLFVLVDASRNEESRDALIGFDAGSRLLYVVHVVVEAEVLRLVSARRATPEAEALYRSEEHTSELQSLMRISYAVFCLKKHIQLKS